MTRPAPPQACRRDRHAASGKTGAVVTVQVPAKRDLAQVVADAERVPGP